MVYIQLRCKLTERQRQNGNGITARAQRQRNAGNQALNSP